MPQKKQKPEEIVAKLRQVNVLVSQGQSVPEALWAITMGAAYTLHMDGEVGSVESGKKADFAVLEADPTTCDPMELRDIPVWGTVQGGRVFAASEL